MGHLRLEFHGFWSLSRVVKRGTRTHPGSHRVRSARARVVTFWGARSLGNGLELREQTSAAHTTWCALCAAE
eukprot:7209157-Prymnesium_polylepis.1